MVLTNDFEGALHITFTHVILKSIMGHRCEKRMTRPRNRKILPLKLTAVHVLTVINFMSADIPLFIIFHFSYFLSRLCFLAYSFFFFLCVSRDSLASFPIKYNVKIIKTNQYFSLPGINFIFSYLNVPCLTKFIESAISTSKTHNSSS